MAEGEFKYKEPSLKKLENPTLYQIVGVSPKASDKEIENGYKEMAKRVYPDLGDAAQKKARNELMQRLSSAKDELLDSVKRASYDSRLEKMETERVRQEQAEASRRADERRHVAAEAERKKRQEAEKSRREAERYVREERERRENEEQEVKKRKENEETKKRGYDLGERLSAWIYTDKGRNEEKRLRDLLIWAAKKQEGLLSVFGQIDGRDGRVDSLIMGMTNANSLEDWGYGSDLAKHIRSRWEKEGSDEKQVEKRFLELERQLIETAHAKQYNDEGNYHRESTIPVNLEPGLYTHRYDYSSAKIWNRQLYVVGFKEGWNKIRLQG